MTLNIAPRQKASQLLSISDLTEILGVSKAAALKWVQSQRLPRHLMPVAVRPYRWTEEQVLEIYERREQGTHLVEKPWPAVSYTEILDGIADFEEVTPQDLDRLFGLDCHRVGRASREGTLPRRQAAAQDKKIRVWHRSQFEELAMRLAEMTGSFDHLDDGPYESVEVAATRIGVGTNRLYRLVRYHKLPSIPGGGNLKLYPHREMDRLARMVKLIDKGWYIPPVEAAQIIGVSRQRLHQVLERGPHELLEPVRIGGHNYLDRARVEQFAQLYSEGRVAMRRLDNPLAHVEDSREKRLAETRELLHRLQAMGLDDLDIAAALKEQGLSDKHHELHSWRDGIRVPYRKTINALRRVLNAQLDDN